MVTCAAVTLCRPRYGGTAHRRGGAYLRTAHLGRPDPPVARTRRERRARAAARVKVAAPGTADP